MAVHCTECGRDGVTTWECREANHFGRLTKSSRSAPVVRSGETKEISAPIALNKPDKLLAGITALPDEMLNKLRNAVMKEYMQRKREKDRQQPKKSRKKPRTRELY